MTPEHVADDWLTLRSSLPGRQRWDAQILWRKPLLARQIETRLREEIGVLDARVNAATGRVLVVFDERALSDVRKVILRVFEKVADGLVLPAALPAVEPEGAETGDSVRALVRSVEKDTHLRWKAAGSTASNTVLSLASPLSLGLLMTAALSGGSPLLAAVGITSPLAQMAAFSGFFLSLKGLETRTNYQSHTLWQRYATDIEHGLRMRAFSHIEYLDMAYLDDQNTSQLMSLVHHDSAQIRRFLETVPDTIISKAGTFALGSVFLLWVSPVSFGLALIPVPFIYALFRRYHKEISRRYQAQGAKEEATKNLLMNSLTGLPTVRSFTAEDDELQRLCQSSLTLQEESNQSFALGLEYAGLTKSALVTGLVLPLAYGGAMVLKGSLSVSTFMLQSFMLPQLISIMGGLDREYDVYQTGVAASRRMSRLLDAQPTMRSGPIRLQREAVKGAVVFDSVSFHYASGARIFDGFDLSIPAGGSVALVGSTGSGKSTLIKLLLRLYDTGGGRILLDGVDIRELNVYDLRKAIGLVSQDVFLFNGTAAENILYGRPDATREEVWEAARIAEATGFIQDLPEGLDTIVGERGQKLSGGQRQRLSIARVVLKNPPILILDEATSSVDNETESAIRRSIEAASRGRTTIYVAHRLSSIRHVDQIHLIDDGRVVERGTHEELVAGGGRYAALWRLQTGESAGDGTSAAVPQGDAVV
ncbi:MAG TPA: ABC transporter ATP-binding protein [Vicinamibacterales bacterium]|jgi:ATP-binding cassette subfamily B protein